MLYYSELSKYKIRESAVDQREARSMDKTTLRFTTISNLGKNIVFIKVIWESIYIFKELKD